MQQSTTSKEFLEWMIYLDLVEDEIKKPEYYAALIASEVRKSYVKSPNKVKLDDLLLEFGREKTSVVGKDISEEETQNRSNESKSFWFGFTGTAKEN